MKCEHEWENGDVYAPIDDCPYCRIAELERMLNESPEAMTVRFMVEKNQNDELQARLDDALEEAESWKKAYLELADNGPLEQK